MKDLKNRFPIYSRLLKLYPRSYRSHYEEEMLFTAREMLDNAESFKERLLLRATLAFDLIISVPQQNLEYAGGIMHNKMPSYIKRNSLVSAVLLAPFFVSITANGIDKLINNKDLYGSWLWHRPFIMLWVLYLPALALMISLVSLLTYIFSGNNKDHIWLKRALDIVHSWPVLVAGFLAFGILFMLEFHDSSQCIMRSPVRSATHIGETLKCVEGNRTIIPKDHLI